MCWFFWDATIFCNNFTLPKRIFGEAEPTFPSAFWKHFSTFRSPNKALTPLKSASKTHSERLVRPPQTKILKTDKRSGVSFRCTFKGCEYKIWATIHWNYFEKIQEIVCSDFQNLRLGSINFTAEHGIPDFISFMRARNPVFWPKMGHQKSGIPCSALL